MRISLLIAFIAMTIASSSFVHAEISISQPKSIYNVGDDLSISISLKSGQNAEGLLKMALVCGNNTNDFYLSPLSLNANQEKRIDANITFNKAFLRDLQGKCVVHVTTPIGDSESQGFEITDRIELTITLNKLNFEAGEQVQLKGTMLKPNAKLFSGFIELALEGTDIKIVRPVNSNQFQVNFTLPENIRSGSYKLQSKVYEKDRNDEITNQGFDETQIAISKVPQKIEIAIATQSVTPGGDISFKVFMYDQANDEVPGDVSVIVKEPENEIIMQKLAKTGELMNFHIENNATAGYWKIEASFQGLSVKRLFYVENQEFANFEIIGDMLYITNKGNTAYRKAVQIAIGDEVEIKELDLEIGEAKKFRLVAPDGIYRVSVTDGKETLTLDTVSLTGNAIGVLTEKSGNIFVKYPLVWIFIIIVFGMFILMMFERFSDRKFIAYNVQERTPIEVKKQWTSEGLTLGGVRQAEHALSLNGHKEEAALVALKIKNMHELSKENLKGIEPYFDEIYDKKGVVYTTGEYFVVILTPSITKTFKNNINAVKIARSISEKLHAHNAKFSKKINFGVGLNYGSIIVEPLRDRLKFASVGNALSLAKRIAELSHGEVLLSKDANAHIDSEIKTEKTMKEGVDLYTLKKVTERGDYHGFISRFLERNK